MQNLQFSDKDKELFVTLPSDFRGLWFPAEVWEDKSLSWNQKLLFGFLYYFKELNREQIINLGKNQLQLSREKTISAYTKLYEKGLISIERRLFEGRSLTFICMMRSYE